ncbi:hypothetical protein CPB85DRAFT_1279209 [Mucidula mucida]|nr:hypothetical protein CPB85DRAFT_1279209 [Mucidula mucida]
MPKVEERLFVSFYEDNFWRGTKDEIRKREARIRGLLGVLKATMWRWKGLRVDITIKAMRACLPGPFNHLEQLFMGTVSGHQSFDGFCRSPRLRCLAFSKAQSADNFRMPWLQITDYGGFALPIGFGMMPNLQSLNISSVSLSDPSGWLVHLPFLTSLTVPLREPDDHARLSEFIDAPALTHLIIRAVVAVPSIYLRDLFDPIFQSLTRLEIFRVNFSASALTLLEFLRETPRVEYLRVSSHLCIEFFDGLIVCDCSSSTNSSLLPALRILDISEAEHAVALDSSIWIWFKVVVARVKGRRWRRCVLAQASLRLVNA